MIVNENGKYYAKIPNALSKDGIPVIEDKTEKNINRWKRMPVFFKACLFAVLAGLVALGVYCYINRLPDKIETTAAFADNNRLWSEFREKNPYNVQLAAIRAYDDGSYNVILSEPSEEVTVGDIRNFFSKYNCAVNTYQSPAGYDGWLRDAVVSFNDIEPAELPEMTAALFEMLYGTGYKAVMYDFTEIPSHTAFSDSDLNMQVSEEELRSWLIDGAETFSTSDGNERETIDAILGGNAMGVFYSDTPGFVVWVLREGASISKDFKVESRIFSLDSDIILGAIKKNGKIAIIGREREESLWDLPPMRSETLKILAGTLDSELAQSYQRNSIIAGKLSGADGGKDWAPILLSNALWHTEYGNILNVTDQMLKSWSENGDIEYEGFDYEKPVYWAFDNGVIRDLGTSTLTYNWNTEGVGYVVDDGEYQIYALNRTGSLPVSFIPGPTEDISDTDPVYRAEELAYDFFSSLSNTSLARVVQYAAMYQIFKNLGISVPDYADSDRYSPVMPKELPAAVEKMLRKIINLERDDYKQLYLTHYGNNNDYDFQSAEYFSDQALGLKEVLDEVKTDNDFMISFSKYLITGNRNDVVFTESRFIAPSFKTKKVNYMGTEFEIPVKDKKKKEKVVDVVNAFNNNRTAGALFAAVDSCHSGACYRDMLCNYNRNISRQWIKCPTVVQSWQNIDSINSIGGHNLNSKVTTFKVDKTLSPGEVREVVIDGKTVYKVSPSDLSRGVTSPSYLRRVGRLGDTSLKGAQTSVRPRTSVVPAAGRAERGASKAHIEVKAVDNGFESNGRRMSVVDLLDDIARRMADGDNTLPHKEIVITNIDKAGTEVQALIDGVAYRMPRGRGTDFLLSRYDMANYSVEYAGDRAIVKIPLKAGRIEFGTASEKNINIKEGSMNFNVPKSRLEQFLQILKEYFKKQRDRWNQFHLERKMKQRGIDPADIEETLYLRVAKNEIISREYVKLVPSKKVS